jgi:hypothetical protein
MSGGDRSATATYSWWPGLPYCVFASAVPHVLPSCSPEKIFAKNVGKEFSGKRGTAGNHYSACGSMASAYMSCAARITIGERLFADVRRSECGRWGIERLSASETVSDGGGAFERSCTRSNSRDNTDRQHR